jgi:hypothetical protein
MELDLFLRIAPLSFHPTLGRALSLRTERGNSLVDVVKEKMHIFDKLVIVASFRACAEFIECVGKGLH